MAARRPGCSGNPAPALVVAADDDGMTDEMPPPDVPPPRVLVADASATMRTVQAFVLRRMGLEPVEAATAEEATRRLREGGPFAVMLVDWMLADAAGRPTFRLLRRDAPETPIVLLVLEADFTGRLTMREAGAFDVLLKPFARPQLEAVVRRWLPDGPGPPDRRAAGLVSPLGAAPEVGPSVRPDLDRLRRRSAGRPRRSPRT